MKTIELWFLITAVLHADTRWRGSVWASEIGLGSLFKYQKGIGRERQEGKYFFFSESVALLYVSVIRYEEKGGERRRVGRPALRSGSYYKRVSTACQKSEPNEHASATIHKTTSGYI